MKDRSVVRVVVAWLSALLFAGCESTTSNTPPVTAALVRAGARERTDVKTLVEGRSLLLNRCIQCHAPPDAAAFSPESLRSILVTMSGRAHLSPEEREAVLKYLLAVRAL